MNTPVTDIVDTLEQVTEDGDIDADQLLDAFGRSAIAPALLVPGLLVASPLSGIPLFSSVCGLAIIILALQGALGREQLWLPGFIRRRTLPQEKTRKATGFMRKFASFLDRLTRRRLSFLVHRPMPRVLYLLCAIGGACIPILELVPLTSSIIGTGVVLVAVAILARDGLFALAGTAVLCAAPMIPFFVVSNVTG